MCIRDRDTIFKKEWDRLHTQKDTLLPTNNNVMIAEVDCSKDSFCEHFIAFDITDLTYPFIGYSYYNEPFKLYDGAMEYPALRTFLFDYFERSCVYNTKWCTEEETLLVKKMNGMTLDELIKSHMDYNYETKVVTDTFEKWRMELQEKFTKRMHEVQKETNERDKLANVIFYFIQKQFPQKEINSTLLQVKKVYKQKQDIKNDT